MNKPPITDAVRAWDYLLVYDNINGGVSRVTLSNLAKNPDLQWVQKGDQGDKGDAGEAGIAGPAGPANLVIGTSAPTPATGAQVLWLDTTGGNVTLNLVTGD